MVVDEDYILALGCIGHSYEAHSPDGRNDRDSLVVKFFKDLSGACEAYSRGVEDYSESIDAACRIGDESLICGENTTYNDWIDGADCTRVYLNPDDDEYCALQDEDFLNIDDMFCEEADSGHCLSVTGQHAAAFFSIFFDVGEIIEPPMTWNIFWQKIPALPGHSLMARATCGGDCELFVAGDCMDSVDFSVCPTMICIDSNTGELRWGYQYSADGSLMDTVYSYPLSPYDIPRIISAGCGLGEVGSFQYLSPSSFVVDSSNSIVVSDPKPAEPIVIEVYAGNWPVMLLPLFLSEEELRCVNTTGFGVTAYFTPWPTSTE